MKTEELLERYASGERCFNKANLGGANLREADLRCADLSEADLRWANLRWANLRGANLSGANLEYLKINSNTNFDNTLLDKVVPLPTISSEEITKAGLVIEGDFVIGYRTTRSKHCSPKLEYKKGCVYTAPYFSISQDDECHPGLYLASKRWMDENYVDENLVRVCCLRNELLNAGDKWRAKRLMVLPLED